VDEHAADLAHHLLRAGSSGRPGDAARYLLIAGRRAFEASAFEEALKHLENAAAMQDALSPRDQAELWFQLGMAHRSVGRWEDALKDWDRALDQLESMHESEQAAVVCWHAAFQLAWAGRFDQALVMAGRGLAAVEGMDTPEHARLLAMGGLMFGSGGYYDAARQMMDQAVEMADRLGDPGARGNVLALRCLFHWEYLESEESIRAGLEAERLLRQAGDLFEVAQVLSFVMFSMMFLGRFDEATEVRERALPLAERFGHHAAYMTLLRGESALLWLTESDPEIYSSLAQRDFDLNRAADLPWIAESFTFLGSNASYRGRKDEATELLRQGVAHETTGFSVGWHRSALLHHLALYGEHDDALALLDDPSTPPAPVPGQPGISGAWSMLVEAIEALGELGERERAAALYPAIEWAIESGVMMEPIRGRLIQTVAGIAAAAAGRWDRAQEHFDAATEIAERWGLKAESVELLRFRAWMHLWRNGDNDRESVLRLSEQAVAEYEAMGMPRHVEVTRALMDEAKA
jgi:tetratricopeptide (TPR) repeat protein